jgi:hypothetical protein
MSNPGVIKLAKKRIGKSRVWLDDNIGESIHIHIDDWRLDLTVEEFERLHNDLLEALEILYPIEGLNLRAINPVYLSLFLVERLPDLTKAKIGYVFLNEILAPKSFLRLFRKTIPLIQTKVYKALCGNAKANDKYKISNHINQTSNERLNIVLNSIKENGYPFNEEYIILYNDEMLVWDGQHRAACLLFLYGNKEVPVLRLYFNNKNKQSILTDFCSLTGKIFRKINVHSIWKLVKLLNHKIKYTLYYILHNKEYHYINKKIQ